MSHLERTIKDLVIFYIKENYNKYLVDCNLTSIDIGDLKAKVSELYYPNKTELKEFVKKCMKEMTKDSPCLLYTSPSPRDGLLSRMPSSA